jgi:chromosome segregation ATPase
VAVASTDLLERFEAARTRADRMESQLREARAAARDAMDVATNAARELVTERAKLEEATDLADRQSERLARSQRELDEARTDLTAAQTELETAREALAAAEAELATLRENTSATSEAETAAREALEMLEREQDVRRRAQDDAGRLADRVHELESHIAARADETDAAVIEDDLRHLLATRQRELDETRAELKEQRGRYAAVASKMSPTELAATTETHPPEDGWSALDDELLGRLARAKELSQQQD